MDASSELKRISPEAFHNIFVGAIPNTRMDTASVDLEGEFAAFLQQLSVWQARCDAANASKGSPASKSPTPDTAAVYASFTTAFRSMMGQYMQSWLTDSLHAALPMFVDHYASKYVAAATSTLSNLVLPSDVNEHIHKSVEDVVAKHLAARTSFMATTSSVAANDGVLRCSMLEDRITELENQLTSMQKKTASTALTTTATGYGGLDGPMKGLAETTLASLVSTAAHTVMDQEREHHSATLQMWQHRQTHVEHDLQRVDRQSTEHGLLLQQLASALEDVQRQISSVDDRVAAVASEAREIASNNHTALTNVLRNHASSVRENFDAHVNLTKALIARAEKDVSTHVRSTEGVIQDLNKRVNFVAGAFDARMRETGDLCSSVAETAMKAVQQRIDVQQEVWDQQAHVVSSTLEEMQRDLQRMEASVGALRTKMSLSDVDGRINAALVNLEHKVDTFVATQLGKLEVELSHVRAVTKQHDQNFRDELAHAVNEVSIRLQEITDATNHHDAQLAQLMKADSANKQVLGVEEQVRNQNSTLENILRSLEAHSSQISSLQLSSDEQRLAATSDRLLTSDIAERLDLMRVSMLDMEAKVTHAASCSETAKEQGDRLKTVIKDVETRLKDVTQMCEHNTAGISAVRSDLEQTGAAYKEMNAALAAVAVELQQLTSDLQQLSTNVTAFVEDRGKVENATKRVINDVVQRVESLTSQHTRDAGDVNKQLHDLEGRLRAHCAYFGPVDVDALLGACGLPTTGVHSHVSLQSALSGLLHAFAEAVQQSRFDVTRMRDEVAGKLQQMAILRGGEESRRASNTASTPDKHTVSTLHHLEDAVHQLQLQNGNVERLCQANAASIATITSTLDTLLSTQRFETADRVAFQLTHADADGGSHMSWEERTREYERRLESTSASVKHAVDTLAQLHITHASLQQLVQTNASTLSTLAAKLEKVAATQKELQQAVFAQDRVTTEQLYKQIEHVTQQLAAETRVQLHSELATTVIESTQPSLLSITHSQLPELVRAQLPSMLDSSVKQRVETALASSELHERVTTSVGAVLPTMLLAFLPNALDRFAAKAGVSASSAASNGYRSTASTPTPPPTTTTTTPTAGERSISRTNSFTTPVNTHVLSTPVAQQNQQLAEQEKQTRDNATLAVDETAAATTTATSAAAEVSSNTTGIVSEPAMVVLSSQPQMFSMPTNTTGNATPISSSHTNSNVTPSSSSHISSNVTPSSSSHINGHSAPAVAVSVGAMSNKRVIPAPLTTPSSSSSPSTAPPQAPPFSPSYSAQDMAALLERKMTVSRDEIARLLRTNSNTHSPSAAPRTPPTSTGSNKDAPVWFGVALNSLATPPKADNSAGAIGVAAELVELAADNSNMDALVS